MRFPLATVRQSIVRVSPGGTAPAGRPGQPACRRHAAPRRPLRTGHQRPWARGPDAAADALRAAVRARCSPSAGATCFPAAWKAFAGATKRRARWQLDAPTPMERARILDPKPDPAGVRETHRRAVDLLPALREARIANAWAGYIDSTPDGVPGIGEVPQVPGLHPGRGLLRARLRHRSRRRPPDRRPGHRRRADLRSRAFRPGRFNESAWGKVADF